MKIIFDLDGPLLDVSERYYEIYKLLSAKYFATNLLTKEEYWGLKRAKIAKVDILKRSEIPESLHDIYINERLTIIENKEHLKNDRLYPFAVPVLEKISNGQEIILISLRNNRENLLWELTHFKIDGFFAGIYSQDNNRGTWEVKMELLMEAGIKRGDKAVFIGDTEADILVAKEMKLTSIAVESGIREKKLLMEFEPDFIINDIRDTFIIL